jgi:peptide/nickel transport system substrate-binding protein
MRKVEGATTRHAHKFIIKRWGNVREVQRHVVSWIIVMGLLIAATGLQLMWYQQSYRTSAPADNGTYAEAVLGPINTLNPLLASTSAEQSASNLMFSRLLRYDKTGHLNYDLATNIKINQANTVYTISIRPDVKWHDGTSLTANDIAYTVSLIKNPNTRTTITGWNDIVVKVIDNTTIEFTLRSTYAAFEHALTFPIVPKHILGGIAPSSIRENKFSQDPIGSGPFKFSFVQNVDTTSSRKVVSMDRNQDYYGGTAKLARFQLYVYDSTDAILHALTLNEVNAAADLSPADISHIDQKRYIVSTKPIQSGTYAIINTKSEFLKDVALRRALELATNTKAILSKMPAGTLALDLPFTNGQITGDVPKAPGYDLVGAKKYLDDAGWKLNAQNIREKDGKQLRLSVVTMKDSEFESVLEILAGQWRSLGITIETKIVDPTDVAQNVVQSILQPRNFDILLYQLNIGADPDVYAYWHSSQISSQGFNFSNYSNAISDDALASARARVEPTLRNAKYITFANQWLADVPAIGLYQSTAQYVRSDNVRSSDKSTVLVTPVDRYSDVLDWSVGSRSVYKTP